MILFPGLNSNHCQVCQESRDLLCPTWRRCAHQEGIHLHHEAFCPREDSRQTELVRWHFCKDPKYVFKSFASTNFEKLKFPFAGLLLTFVNWVSLERCSNLWNFLGSFSSSSCFTTINQVKIFAHWSFDFLSFDGLAFLKIFRIGPSAPWKRQLFSVQSWYCLSDL